MEQKKTLWIALSAGIFLLVVLGAALVIYSPGARTNTSAIAMRDNGLIYTASLPAQSASQGGVIASNVGGSVSASGTNTPSISTTSTPVAEDGIVKTDKVTVIADTANVYAKGDVTAPSSASSSVSYNTTNSNSSSSNVTAVNQKGEVAIKETGNKKKVEEPAPAKSGQTAKAPAADKGTGAAQSTESKASATTKASATAKTSSGSTASKTSSSIAPHYWVQVASYSTKDNADEARKILDSKDLPCEVFTFTKDSKLYYRVRVGPYKTKGEAETCKKSVDSIALFKSAQSYIVDSSARASR